MASQDESDLAEDPVAILETLWEQGGKRALQTIREFDPAGWLRLVAAAITEGDESNHGGNKSSLHDDRN